MVGTGLILELKLDDAAVGTILELDELELNSVAEDGTILGYPFGVGRSFGGAFAFDDAAERGSGPDELTLYPPQPFRQIWHTLCFPHRSLPSRSCQLMFSCSRNLNQLTSCQQPVVRCLQHWMSNVRRPLVLFLI